MLPIKKFSNPAMGEEEEDLFYSVKLEENLVSLCKSLSEIIALA